MEYLSEYLDWNHGEETQLNPGQVDQRRTVDNKGPRTREVRKPAQS